MNPDITYYKNGQIKAETWRNETREHHRVDGPAYQEWYSGGQLWSEIWCINGKLHRLDGPAAQSWCKDGQVAHEAWYINGVEYETEAEFLVAVDLYKANEIAELF